jgi:hypothetical protein
MRILILLAALLLPALLPARGHSASYRSYSRGYSSQTHTPKLRSYCYGCARDRHGRIKRSPAARVAFRSQHPCPATGRTTGVCPGYVIDHVQALRHGGADTPLNMQWQRIRPQRLRTAENSALAHRSILTEASSEYLQRETDKDEFGRYGSISISPQ